MTGRVVEVIRGKKYKVIIEAGKDPQTGKRKRLVRIVNGRKPDAEREMANIIRELEDGTYLEPSKMNVAEYLRYWLENYAATNLAPSTYASYVRIINGHIIPNLGGVELIKLQPLQIQAYYTKALKEGRRDGKGGLSPRTVQYHHRVLREALQHAIQWQMLKLNPADATHPPKPEKPEIHPLEQEELDKLLEHLGGHRDKWLFMFAAYSGMRQGELLGLKWSDVDWGGKTISIRRTVGWINGQGFVFRNIGKSKKALRNIHLLDAAVYALRKQKKQLAEERLAAFEYEDMDLVFPNMVGRPYNPSDVSGRFGKEAKKAGFNIRFHDLRHTFATFMLKLGVHPKIVQEYLGHETIGITMDTYSHVIKGMQQEAVTKANDFLNSKWHQNGTKTQKSHP